MSNPNDWLQVYHQNFRPPPNSAQPFSGLSASVPPSDTTAGAVSDASVSQSSSTRLIPDHGRVAKPVRRRSRASRRTPTTLLNTDTSNFRTMVQQFTGGPSAPFAPSSNPGQSNLGFGFAQASQPVNLRPFMIPPEFHIQAQQNLFHHQNQQQFMITLNSNNQINPSAGTYGFPPTLEGSTEANLMGLSGGTSLDGVSPESANGGRRNNFIR